VRGHSCGDAGSARIVHIFVRADRVGEKVPIPDHVRRMLQRYSVEEAGSPIKSQIIES
jgi:hypothetical protein